MGSEKVGAQKFLRNIRNFKKIQESLLLNYIEKNIDTLFGKVHNFKEIKSLKDFKKFVPVRDYKGFLEYTEKIKKGERNVLTSEKVLFLHPTGGTTGTKLIPYTKTLRKEFQRALSPWFYDVFTNFPDIKKGKTYWVITPAGKKLEKFADSKVKVGFAEDNEYFGLKGKILSFIQAVPFNVSKIENIDVFKFLTSLFLVKEKNITWISLWSPTFLEIIIDEINKNIEFIIKSLFEGKICLPSYPGYNIPDVNFRGDRKRAKEVEKIFKFDEKEKFKELWQNLRFISMWMSAESFYPAQRLKKIFPDTYFQPKGLLLTEGIVSFPLEAAEGCVPAYSSHFFEFISENENEILNLWELEEGGIYGVIITTGGGLYRYDTGDMLRVKGFYKNLPVLEFIGRKGNFSDLVGEKLSGDFVNKCIKKALDKIPLSFRFLMMSPEEIENKYMYVLFVDSEEDDDKVKRFSMELEERLKENFYYKKAVEMGQLEQMKIFKVKDGLKTYLTECMKKGQRLGDIKPVIFNKNKGWIKVFGERILKKFI